MMIIIISSSSFIMLMPAILPKGLCITLRQIIKLVQYFFNSASVFYLLVWPTPSPDFWKMGSAVVVQPCSQTDKQTNWKHNLHGGCNYWSVFVGTSKRPHTQLRFNKLVLEWRSKLSCVWLWSKILLTIYQVTLLHVSQCSVHGNH